MPTFKIDGKDVPFEKGDTILRAAYRAGIDIPYYCWHPGLSVAANCRMCLVEILPPPGRPPMLLDVLELDRKTGQYVNTRKPKLQPACQVPAAENMEVLSDTSEHVLRARHAVQEFLLLNHPVDCPICDQAGECKLQDYWLEHMGTAKRMRDEPVHKPKAVSFGPTIVYDAERCIVCTRCVRFCKEVAKDPVLSVRERGNVNEITVSPGRQLDHPYTFMTEHVCPVGALTTKDFRFKARVWFLRSAKAICQGCATGCNAWLDFDPRYQRAYRYRPRDNEKVNEFWMCDEGMLSYRTAHDDRITQARVGGKKTPFAKALTKAAEAIREGSGDKAAILLSAQHSCEDNFALVVLAKALGIKAWFVAGRPDGEGDDILRHVDKNPNTAGARLVAEKDLGSFEDLTKAIEGGTVKHVIALGSALPRDDVDAQLKQLDTLVVIASWASPLSRHADVFLPACSWAEAHGLYVNAKGIAQESRKAIQAADDAQAAWKVLGDVCRVLGHEPAWKKLDELRTAMPKACLPEPEKPASAVAEDNPDANGGAAEKAEASADS
jgi:NADH-quinone oxidoreductase subunit G